MTWNDSRTKGIALICAVLVILVTLYLDSTNRNRLSELAQAKAQAAAKVQRAKLITEQDLPWMVQSCGFGHFVPECDRRAWPGGAYPTEPLPGEKTSGVDWKCTPYKQEEYGNIRTCSAYASAERRAKYPCYGSLGPCKGGDDAYRRLAVSNGWRYELRR